MYEKKKQIFELSKKSGQTKWQLMKSKRVESIEKIDKMVQSQRIKKKQKVVLNLIRDNYKKDIEDGTLVVEPAQRKSIKRLLSSKRKFSDKDLKEVQKIFNFENKADKDPMEEAMNRLKKRKFSKLPEIGASEFSVKKKTLMDKYFFKHILIPKKYIFSFKNEYK